MNATPENIHPQFDKMLGRDEKEKLLGQRGFVLWLYGLSGSGKSALAHALERRLHADGVISQLLDGDNIRSGLNRNLGFSDDDRSENIRRIAEVAKLFLNAGVVTIASFITPGNALRSLAREIVGGDDFFEVFVKCPLEKCAQRDVKGLYAKAETGQIKQFTGRDSVFEEPENPDLIIETETQTLEESVATLYQAIAPRLNKSR